MILPYHDPRTIAETYAMLDEVSHGRLQLGVGTGFQSEEYARYDVDFQARHERFSESLAAIRQLLKGARVSLEGKHYTLKNVGLNIVPVQKDVPILSRPIGPMGLNNSQERDSTRCVCLTPISRSVDEVSRIHRSLFRSGRAAAGTDMDEQSVQFGFHTYVGESKAEAQSTAGEAFAR